MQVNHHVKYKEIHGIDEVVPMEKGEHNRLHRRLRKEGKCNIPQKILAKISVKANARLYKTFKTTESAFDRLKKFGVAGESINTALKRVLDIAEAQQKKR